MTGVNQVRRERGAVLNQQINSYRMVVFANPDFLFFDHD